MSLLVLALVLAPLADACEQDVDCVPAAVCRERPDRTGSWCVPGCRAAPPHCPEGAICRGWDAPQHLPGQACFRDDVLLP